MANDPTQPGTATARRSVPSLRRRLAFALLPVLALLLVAELGIRLVRAPLHFGSFRVLRTDLLRRNYPAELDAQLGYVPKAGYASTDNHWGTTVSIDADGMRRNGPGPAPPGDRVIAAVGDSFTFGDQVDDDETWPARLEQLLARPVNNGGVFGYSFTQAVLRAERMLGTLPVDTLIVSFIPDDLTRCEFERRYTPLPWFDLVDGELVARGVPIDHAARPVDAGRAWKDLLGHSALLDVVLASAARAWWYENEKQVRVPHLAGRGAEIASALLTRLSADCERRDVRLLLLLQGKQHTDEARSVLRHAEAAGVRTLDLIDRYEALLADDQGLAARWFAGHMTPEGNRWVASEVAAALRDWR